MNKGLIVLMAITFLLFIAVPADAQQSGIEITLLEGEYATGENITIQAELPAQASAAVTFELDGPDGSPLVILTSQTNADGIASVSFSIDEEYLASDAYTIYASANVSGSVVESSEPVQISYPSPLNLESGDITFSQMNPAVGDSVWIYAVIHNEGNSTTSGIVTFYDEWGMIGTQQSVVVPGYEEEVSRIEWTPSSDGVQNITVKVDCGLEYKADEETKSITVGGTGSPILVLDTGDMNIYRFEPGEERTISVDVTCYQTTVNNVRLVCLDDQNLTIDTTVTPPRTMTDGETIVFYLTVQAPEQERGANTEFDIVIQAIGDEAYSNAEELDIVITDSALSFLGLVVIGSGVAIASFSAAGVAITRNESWKYWLFSVALAPLYAKVKKDKVLDHFVRGQIFGHIKTNPGSHYNEIKEVLGVANGVLAHHLRTLEREEFIKSRKEGKLKRFYPSDMNIDIDKNGIQLSEAQLEIIDVIRQHPGISQSEIARNLNKDRRAIAYHIKQLERADVIKLEKEGRETKCYIEEVEYSFTPSK